MKGIHRLKLNYLTSASTLTGCPFMKSDKFETQKSLFWFDLNTLRLHSHLNRVTHSLSTSLPSSFIMSAKLNTFTTLLQAGQYEIDAGFQDFIVKCVADSKLQEPIVITQAPVAGTQSKVTTKKPTAYNIFVSEKMKSLVDVPSNERMAAVGALWKTLSAEDKAIYETKAKETTPYEVTVSPNQAKKGPKTLTNWQFFVSEKMPEVKAMADVKPKERLGKIGELWKLVSDADKQIYKTKAGVKDTETKANALAIAQA
jgi:hypothetical protein